MLTTPLNVISIISWALYIGPMLAFTALFILQSQIVSVKRADLVATFQLWGAGFGLSLGALIFSLLLARWQQYGEYVLYWSESDDQLQSLGIIFGLLAWISNMILEVWTLDPLRKLSQSTENHAYDTAFKTLRRHMVVHCVLWLIAATLFVSSLN